MPSGVTALHINSFNTHCINTNIQSLAQAKVNTFNLLQGNNTKLYLVDGRKRSKLKATTVRKKTVSKLRQIYDHEALKLCKLNNLIATTLVSLTFLIIKYEC